MLTLPPMQVLEQECARLRGLFDKKLPGFDKIKHLFIEFDYEHLFIPKLTANGKKINGFHHDMNGILESMGLYN